MIWVLLPSGEVYDVSRLENSISKYAFKTTSSLMHKNLYCKTYGGFAVNCWLLQKFQIGHHV